MYRSAKSYLAWGEVGNSWWNTGPDRHAFDVGHQGGKGQ